MDLTKLTKIELLAKCEEHGITKCKTKNKGELIELINNKNTSTNVEEEIIQVNTTFELIIPIPDCFVSNHLKLSNGKNGHGERRLYTGNSNSNNEYICTKPWLLNYADNYKNEIDDLLNDDSNFSRECEDRKDIVHNAIDHCNKKLIHVTPQNGNEDVVRYYIGPNKNNKENIKLYDTFRCTVIPKLYSLNLIEREEYFECNIIKNDIIDKKQKNKKTSSACVEYLNYLSNTYCIEIQHEHNKGEFQLRNPQNGYFWPVDGYHNCTLHKCSGDAENPCQYNNNIWEFQGDYFHGNPLKYDQNDAFHGVSYSKKYNKDLDKKNFYEEKGFVVNIKWESEWVEEKKAMKKNNIKWY
jgi:hypothetical protein